MNKHSLLTIIIALFALNILSRKLAAAPVPVAKSAVVAGATALPALSVSSGTPTNYSITYPLTEAGSLYVGSNSLSTGTTTVALADITRLRFVPVASIATNTTVTFIYTATDASGTSIAVAYTLTLVKASTLDFSTRTASEDWTAGKSVTVDNTTLIGSAFAYSASATTHTLAIGNPSSRLPGTALAWGSTYGTTTNPGTDGANNTSTYTFTFTQPVSYFTLTLTDIDAGTSASNSSDFIDNITLNAYSSASSTTAITYDNVSMATVVNSAATPTLARTVATNTVLGTANNNATVNGTVVVSFAAQVQRLVITYKNTATYTSGNNRIQNLGIPSMTWAYSLTPLPVTLVSFTAKIGNNHTGVVAWATASEQDNDHFAIERSLNGTEFVTVGSVVGQGTSSSAHAYSFTDTAITYSSVQPIQFTIGASLISLYPNPVTDVLNIDLSWWPAGTYQVIFLRLTGQQQAAFALQGGQFNALDVQALPAGYYVVRLAGEQSSTLRFFKQ